MRAAVALLVCVVCGFACHALAAQRTVLTVDPPTRADGLAFAPEEPRYSQAINVVLHLSREDDTPVLGADCPGAPCSIIVEIGPIGGAPALFAVINAQGFVTDTTGTATARITFVDGRYGADSAFPASNDGVPYTIAARFLGSGAGQVPSNPDCVPGAVDDTPDPDLCGASASVDVELFSETADIAPGAGLEGALGDTITLSAFLEDANGDAALQGTDVDGSNSLVLVGRTVTFFYDVDNDGNAEGTEVVGTADTNEAGVASLAFTLDPAFIRAGEYNQGLSVEFGGDGRYGVARAAERVVVRPADANVSKTLIEVDPPEIPADGFSKATILVRLVDAFNNPLDENSLPHDVVITSDNGLLLDVVELDPLSGAYVQLLQAQRKDATATISVTVDGVAAPATATVAIVGAGGCTCASSARTPANALALLVGLAGLRALARRHARAR